MWSVGVFSVTVEQGTFVHRACGEGAGLWLGPAFGGTPPRMASSQGRWVPLQRRAGGACGGVLGSQKPTATVHFRITTQMCGWVAGCRGPMLRRNVRLKIWVESQRHADRWGLKPWGWTRGRVLRQTAGHEREPPDGSDSQCPRSGSGRPLQSERQGCHLWEHQQVNTAQS